LTSIVLPESLKTISIRAFADNALTGEIVIPGNVTIVSADSFSGNPGITQFKAKLYRNKASDPGIYDDEAGVYMKATSNVTGSAPWGASHLNVSNNIFYMDDPRPLYTSQIVRNAAKNTVTIKLSVIMSENQLIGDIAGAPGMPAVSNLNIHPTGGGNSTVEMLVGDNGSYTFITTFYGIIKHQYTVPINEFSCNVTYHANGGTGTAPVDNTNYLPGAPLTPSDGCMLEKEGCTLVGWNTQADGKGVTYAPGVPKAINGQLELHAMWKDVAIELEPDWVRLNNAINGGFGTEVDKVVIHQFGTYGDWTSADGKTFNLVISDDASAPNTIRTAPVKEHFCSTDPNDSTHTIEVSCIVALAAADGTSIELCMDSKGRHFIVNGGSLSIGGATGMLVLDGGFSAGAAIGDDTAGGVYVGNTGAFTINSGAAIQACLGINGGGVKGEQGSAVTMGGGEISG